MKSSYLQKIRNLFFNLAYQTGISAPFRWALAKNNDLVILMFHRVSDHVDPRFPPIPVASFRSLMEELAKLVSR